MEALTISKKCPRCGNVLSGTYNDNKGKISNLQWDYKNHKCRELTQSEKNMTIGGSIMASAVAMLVYIKFKKSKKDKA
ncbi:MAG TPA: hypothetical protein VN026_18005 [Bacteroidia bacterium]|jgi:hypothetical protein|nr:hypothetical protein [Bacteroidia bacterium]